MNFKVFNLTAQGASHIKKNRECQDASQSFVGEDYGIAVVCDGHGGDDYVRSAVGSDKASKIALEHIKEFVEHVNRDELKRHFDELLHSLEASIISRWFKEISDHWEETPVTKEEESRLSEKAKKRYFLTQSIASAYGTTLIAVVVTKDYWFCFQVGDGKCVWINKDSQFDQLALDKKCFLNATTSLCDSDALDHFQTYYSEDIPAAVFVGSDGIDDCFKNDAQLYSFYKTMSYSFGTTDTEKAVAELKDFLPRLSQKGSGDDVSIAAVLNMDLLPTIEAVTGFNRDDERAKKQKAEQEEAKRNAELKEQYEREAAAARQKREDEKRKADEAAARQQEILSRKQSADEEMRLAKVIQELESAKKLVEDAKIKMDKAEIAKNLAMERLKEASTAQEDYNVLRKVYDDRYNNYMKYLYNYQSAVGKLGATKVVYDSVVRSYGAKCPNPECNEINRASAKFCSKCGALMTADPTSFAVPATPVIEEPPKAEEMPEKDATKEATGEDINLNTTEEVENTEAEVAEPERDNPVKDEPTQEPVEVSEQPQEEKSAIVSEDEKVDKVDVTESDIPEDSVKQEPDPFSVETVSITRVERVLDGNSYSYTQSRIDIQKENGEVVDVKNSTIEHKSSIDDDEW